MPSSVRADSVSHVANSTATPYQAEFKKLSFYLARNEVALFPKWNTYDSLFGSIKWQPNMGNTLNGLVAVPSPVERITFAPNILSEFPAKDQFSVGERYETAKLGAHRFESSRFRFLSNFESFWRDQLQYAHKDIVRQIALANNIFIRTLMYYQSPDVYVCGADPSGQLTSQMTLPTNVDKRQFSGTDVRVVTNGDDSSSSALDPVVSGATITNSGGIEYRDEFCFGAANNAEALTLKDLYKAMLVLQEDVQAPTFERQHNAPRTSEMLKGKYVLICSTEAWSSLLWDTNLRTGTGTGAATQLAPANMDLLKDGFAGDLWGKITARFDPYPLRFSDNGTFIAPQTIADATTGKVTPNTNYTTISATSSDTVASNEVGKNMNAKKFYSMKWNGEVTLTDQFLIPSGGGGSTGVPLTDTGTQDLNVYGDYLKFIAQAVFGGIPGDARHCLPIFYRRRRTS